MQNHKTSVQYYVKVPPKTVLCKHFIASLQPHIARGVAGRTKSGISVFIANGRYNQRIA